jgi:hypothetical protein
MFDNNVLGGKIKDETDCPGDAPDIHLGLPPARDSPGFSPPEYYREK